MGWWHHNNETPTAGKLLIGIEGVQQAFFDDNIGNEVSGFKIVDPRAADTFMPKELDKCLGKVCLRVDPMEAILKDVYFIDLFNKMNTSLDNLWYDDDPTPDARRASTMAGKISKKDGLENKDEDTVSEFGDD